MLGAMNTSGYAALANQRSHSRSIEPKVFVRCSIHVSAVSPYQYPMRKNSGSESSSRSGGDARSS